MAPVRAALALALTLALATHTRAGPDDAGSTADYPALHQASVAQANYELAALGGVAGAAAYEAGGVRLGAMACDDGAGGALRDLLPASYDASTGEFMSAAALCIATGGAPLSRSAMLGRCAAEASPAVWVRRQCAECDAPVCVGLELGYQLGGAAVQDGFQDRTEELLPVSGAGASPVWPGTPLPAYAAGEPPVSDRYRPLEPAWGEYAYLPPQRWLHALKHAGVVVLYDPCVPASTVEFLRATIRGLHHAANETLRGKLRTPGLEGGSARWVLTPYVGLGRPFAVLVWGAGLMSHCAADAHDFGKVQVDIAAFLERHYGGEGVRPHAWRNGPYNLGLTAGVPEAAAYVAADEDQSYFTTKTLAMLVVCACCYGLGAVWLGVEIKAQSPMKLALRDDANSK